MSAPVTVAVVSWNTRELLRACLRSLQPEADAGRAEVWVVDNASSDGSGDMVRQCFSWVSLATLDQNLGFGRAVNLVARRTQSEWIAAANADIELTDGALTAMLATGAEHPEAAAIAPRLLLPDGSTQHTVNAFPTLPYTLAFNLALQKLSRSLGDRLCLHGYWDADREREVDWAMGAFLMVRRAAFDAVGGFDEEQWMYAEDLDLGWRLARAGWTTRYQPAAAVRHRAGAAAEQAFGEESIAKTQEATYAWMVRRRGLARTWAAAVVNIIAISLRFLALVAPAAVDHDRWGWRRDRARTWTRAHRAGLRSRKAILEQR